MNNELVATVPGKKLLCPYCVSGVWVKYGSDFCLEVYVNHDEKCTHRVVPKTETEGVKSPAPGPMAAYNLDELGDKLLPCPFCGGKAKIHGSGSYDCPRFRVRCDECGCGTSRFDEPVRAKSAWNRRDYFPRRAGEEGEEAEEVG